MTIQSDLFTFLKTNVGTTVSNRIYYKRAPQGADGAPPKMPFVVYQIIDKDYVTDLDGVGTDGETEFQIDVCATTFAQAQAISKTIKTELADWDVPDAAFFLDYDEFLDDDVEPALPRVAQQWGLRHSDA